MVEDDDVELEDDAEDASEDGDVEEEEAALASDEEESEEASLEELLAQRASARRGGEDAEDAEDDIMALSSEKDTAGKAALPSKVIPIKDRQEFVCQSCHLVKARSQLADEKKMYCRDCA
jgi:Domain of unknown function (DUF4193)